jgi:hypothetical protein
LSCFIKVETNDYIIYAVLPTVSYVNDFYNIFGKYILCYECIFYKVPEVNNSFLQNLNLIYLLFSSLNLVDMSLFYWGSDADFYIYITLRELICELYFDYLNTKQELPCLGNAQVIDAYSYIVLKLQNNLYYRIRFYIIMCRYFFLTLI